MRTGRRAGIHKTDKLPFQAGATLEGLAKTHWHGNADHTYTGKRQAQAGLTSLNQTSSGVNRELRTTLGELPAGSYRI